METAKSKPKTGRPSKFVPEVATAVLAHVRRGSPRHIAANAAGLGRSTLMRWMARGKSERRGQFRDFWDALKKAEAELVIELVQRINAAAERGTWQAAAWTLERRYPEIYSTHAKELAALRKEVVELRKLVPPDVQDGRDNLSEVLTRIAATLTSKLSPNAELEIAN